MVVNCGCQAGTRAPLVACQATGPLPLCAARSGPRDSCGSPCSPPGSSSGLWSSRQDTFNPSWPRLANDRWCWNDKPEFRDTSGPYSLLIIVWRKYDNLLGSFTIQLIATKMLFKACGYSGLFLNWFLLSKAHRPLPILVILRKKWTKIKFSSYHGGVR